MRSLRLVLKLARLKMTVFSAVTYAVASLVGSPGNFGGRLFFAGWAFVFFTQLVAHFLGQYPFLCLSWSYGFEEAFRSEKIHRVGNLTILVLTVKGVPTYLYLRRVITSELSEVSL